MTIKGTAHSAVARAISKGILNRSEICESCGSKDNVVAHHPDYTQPLNVIWLCLPCHKQLHIFLNPPPKKKVITPGWILHLKTIGEAQRIANMKHEDFWRSYHRLQREKKRGNGNG
jgi:hypothetical protein